MSFNKSLFAVSTVAVLSLLSAGSAMAAGEFLDLPVQTATSTTTRAAVQAEVLAARAAGRLAQGGEFLSVDKASGANSSVLTRAEVKADVQAARAAGKLVSGGEILQVEPASRPARAGRIVAQHGATLQQ
jgi:hypothetical protein